MDSWSSWHLSILVSQNPVVNLLVDESEEGRLGIPTNTRARADHSPLLPHSTISCNKRPPRVSLTHRSTPPFPCSTHLARKNFYSPLSTAFTPAGYVHLKTEIMRHVLLYNKADAYSWITFVAQYRTTIHHSVRAEAQT